MTSPETVDQHPSGIDKMFRDFQRKIDAFNPPLYEIKKISPELTVTRVTENVITAFSSESLTLGTTIRLSPGQQGLVFDLRRRTDIEEDSAPHKTKPIEAQIISLGDTQKLKPGDIITSSEQMLTIHVCPEIIGSIIDPLGNVLDGHEYKKTNGEMRPIITEAPTILERQEVNRPLHTGINAIDLTCPIGRGQRELIVGDQGTGKTALAVGTILAQRNEQVTCVYVAVGKKMQEIARIIETLKNAGAMEYTSVIIAPADAPDGMKYIAPYSGMAIAEWVRSQGKDALVVFDDLSLHAQAYRKIAVSLGYPRGREAYPGDTFAIHSTLLERAGQLHKRCGGGSITAIPIVSIKGDITAYIPTNIISITDGQIILDPKLANQNIKPAIDIGKSVSRIGSKAQPEIIKQVSKNVKNALVELRELEAFGTETIRDEETKQTLIRGQRIQEFVIQPPNNTVSVPLQAIMTFAIMKGYFDHVPKNSMGLKIREISRTLETRYQDILEAFTQGKVPLGDNSNGAEERDPYVMKIKNIFTAHLTI